MASPKAPGRTWLRLLVLALAAVAGAGAGAVWLSGRGPGRDPLADARRAYARGDWKAASAKALEQLEQTADEPEALRLLARASVRLEQDATGLSLYARIDPRQMTAEDHYLKGLALGRRGNGGEAVREWEAAVAADPDHVEALEGLAEVYAQTSRFEKAAEAAERLARHAGTEAKGNLMLGVLRAELNDPAGAAEALARALELDPSPPSAARYRKLLARVLLRTGRPGDAQAQAERVLSAEADQEAFWLLSRARLQQGATAEAEAALAAAGSYRAEHPLDDEPSPYAGAAACAGCHPAEFKAEQASRHARSLYHGRDLLDLPRPEQPLPDPGDARVTHAIERSGDALQATTLREGQATRMLIDYAFGTSDRYLTMVGHDAQGRSRALRLSYYHSEKGSGWDLTSGDKPRPADPEGYLGKPVDVREGQIKCLACHTTNTRGGRERTGPETADRGVGCERCHGPGGNHVKAVAAKFSDLAIVNPAPARGEAITQRVCGQCHSLNEPINELTTPHTDPIWLRSQSTTLAWSRCYTESAGALSCLTCHDPHRGADRSPAHYEAKCLSCHAADKESPGEGPSAATSPVRHIPCPVNPTRDCLTCHMPRIQDTVIHNPLTDHYIRVRKPGP